MLSIKWQNEASTIPVNYEELPGITFFLIPKIQTWLRYRLNVERL